MSQMWVPGAVITAVVAGDVAVLAVAVLLPPAPPTSLQDDFTPPGLCRTAPAVTVPAATAISFCSFPNTSWYASNWLMSSTFTLKNKEEKFKVTLYYRLHITSYSPYFSQTVFGKSLICTYRMATLTDIHSFPQYLHANGRTVLQIRPWPIPNGPTIQHYLAWSTESTVK